MAKDDRLYARFDINMDEHPKIMLLSDRAFRALIESTLYSRRLRTDGFLNEQVAIRKWGRKAVDELMSNDPERPSLVRVEGGWQIHDFHKHQTTNADIEAKREAGRLGGLAKARRNASKGLAPASESLKQKAGTTSTSPLGITETETETSTSNEVEREPHKRGSRLSPEWKPAQATVDQIRTECPTVDYQREHSTFIDYWIAQPGQRGVKLDWDATWRNWMRRATPSKQTRTQENLSVVAKYAAQEAAEQRGLTA